ncbi:hypothetical protein DW765_15275 [Phocaeicola vulgatus]|uniref:Uncharacterized protein n=2 Tax=Bacteroides TaxID=816 RepID=A0A3E4UQ77_BACSE|nr:hypothetical protein F9949_12260 [Bacteroides stercoris]RGT11679.1 hypothetical protein DWX51_14810 [Bacteroides uniformis]RHE14334.1 hypothetical protein DW765_15275 [Phocaeicola vulgatus]KAB5326529.1 hypothetical protein F9950_11720 [Bacteroides stercoris]KAB5332017.1 hypothetical protein F9944_14810 [Bacteroides stercoris]
MHSCNTESNATRTVLHSCNVTRHAGSPCNMYDNVPTGMILHPCHVPPVASKQYTLQDNVPMYALMHCAKSSGYF